MKKAFKKQVHKLAFKKDKKAKIGSRPFERLVSQHYHFLWADTGLPKDEELKTKTYKASSLKIAADRMEKFLSKRIDNEETSQEPKEIWLDQDVTCGNKTFTLQDELPQHKILEHL